MLKRAQPIKDGCNPVFWLYFKESTAVVYALQKEDCLNKRSEFILFCGHIQKFLFNQNKFQSIYSHLVVVFVNFSCLFRSGFLKVGAILVILGAIIRKGAEGGGRFKNFET